MRNLLGVLLVCFAALCAISLQAQSPSSPSGSTNSQANNARPVEGNTPSNAGKDGGGNGGRVIQDWSTLMMLISQTIDPDEWRDFGGTGESTMIPYPNGVWIDAQGNLKRMERRTGLGGDLQSSAAHQDWMKASGLRAISLKKLDATLSSNHQLGLTATRQLQTLAGLSHIQYVLVDREAHDVILAGPASTQLNVLELEDLCLLLNVMSDHTAPLGCSLEPNNQGLAAASQFLSHPNTIARLGRSPQIVADQLKKQVGPHQVRVFGIEPKCSTALALVNADELMKRYGLGLSKGPVTLKTYFDHLARGKSLKPQSLIRWWFAYTDKPVVANRNNSLFEMPRQAAAVLSQEQWIAATGQREPTGKVDPAADGFAKEFTDKFMSIAASEPAFARIEGIFELGLALQVAIDASQQTSLREWFPNLCQEAHAICLHERAPTSVDGVTAYDRLSNGTVVAVISGGVTLDPASRVAQQHSQQREHISQPDQLKQLSSSANWWHD